MNIDLKCFGLGKFFCQLLILMDGDGDVLDGLLEALVVEVGLAEVKVGQDKSEIRFTIVKD